ncbi:DNA/RNA non-specific endonuclease [Rhodomicrobium vannielii ATCC 17100]|uniref:DNA/RNA non-specific endonuclease n=1 Tax=Rhodomicrobium vannielii TaxID=1069 RepID=UPI00191A1A61|nr:DNA/RNA non-specific endonuclease [Rhodomicrobium vannielii]MBJ7533202.1 DNA/RNA non-specific endonuclease [Rhodomicrobium vannielii ATCC 17100]
MALLRRAQALLILLFAALALGQHATPGQAQERGCDAQLYRGGFPAIKSEQLARETYGLCFSEIAVLYSGVSRTPLWAAEMLTPARVAAAKTLTRIGSNAFHDETLLPSEVRAELADYKRSGFDRGHMAPNGDMSTRKAQEESFSLANMIPQHPCNNEVLWEGIESAVRDIAESETVYVVTGPAFLGAELESLKGRVLVPTHVFKAIYVPSRNAAAAFFAPNDDSQAWETLSIDELEAKVGVDAFPQLDGAVRRRAMILPRPTPHYGCRLQTSEAAGRRR